MKIDNKTGLLETARYLPTVHCDDRPATNIDMIVIHGISLPPAQFGTGKVEEFFCGQLNPNEHPYFQTIADLRVAAHLFIDRKGVITQFVPFNKRAWHAGRSSFQGREECNDFSIGIELEGTDNLAYEKIQYSQLAGIIDSLMRTYPDITRKRIVGHSDVAPGRKTDPGPHFDWAYLDQELQTLAV